jgi:hypothetical protein
MNKTNQDRFDPSIHEFYDAQKAIIDANLKGVRAAISHPGEKGRTLEIEVNNLIRSFLPAEYGLSTGFVMYHNDSCLTKGEYRKDKDKIHLSNQIDLIIYDALRGGPIIHFDTCDVFPLESVIAYFEVKMSISSLSGIRNLLDQTNKLRSMKVRFYWITMNDNPTGAQLIAIPAENAISIRSYVFVADGSKLGTSEEIRKMIENEVKEHKGKNTFLTGLYINNGGFYASVPISNSNDPKNGSIILEKDNPLFALKNSLNSSLSRYPRIPEGGSIAIDLYNE